MQGTHLDFEFHLSFQKIQAKLSLLWKRVLICSWRAFLKPQELAQLTFWKPRENSFQFSKMQENSPTNRAKGTTNPRKNSANREKESIRWCSRIFLKTQMIFNSCLLIPCIRILKMNKILRGLLQKLRLINNWLSCPVLTL